MGSQVTGGLEIPNPSNFAGLPVILRVGFQKPMQHVHPTPYTNFHTSHTNLKGSINAWTLPKAQITTSVRRSNWAGTRWRKISRFGCFFWKLWTNTRNQLPTQQERILLAFLFLVNLKGWVGWRCSKSKSNTKQSIGSTNETKILWMGTFFHDTHLQEKWLAVPKGFLFFLYLHREKHHVWQGSVGLGNYTGVITLPTQTMHYYKGSTSKYPYVCIVWLPPNG